MTATPYNFQKPGPLARAEEQQFVGWLQQGCALATRIWQKQTPGCLRVEYRDCDAARAADALQAVSDGALGWRVLLHDELPTVMIWPRSLILAVVGALLDDPSPASATDRDLTVVEESLFEFFLKDLLLPRFLETWTGRIGLKPVLGAKEPHPRWLRLYELDESLMASTLSLQGTFAAQEWRWLMPKTGLLASLHPDGAVADETAAVQRRLQNLVREMPIAVTVKLGSVELPLAQLAQLQIGDVIVLDQRINQPLKATVGDRDKILGWPGKQGNRQALQIDHLEP
jgi:flagellar motor switch protein FliM